MNTCTIYDQASYPTIRACGLILTLHTVLYTKNAGVIGEEVASIAHCAYVLAYLLAV